MQFRITPTEIFKLFIVLTFGFFAWMFYTGVEEWITSTYDLGYMSMIWAGLFGFAVLLFLFKSKILRFALG